MLFVSCQNLSGKCQEAPDASIEASLKILDSDAVLFHSLDFIVLLNKVCIETISRRLWHLD